MLPVPLDHLGQGCRSAQMPVVHGLMTDLAEAYQIGGIKGRLSARHTLELCKAPQVMHVNGHFGAPHRLTHLTEGITHKTGAPEPLPQRGIIDFTSVGAVAVVSLAPLRPPAPGLVNCRHFY